MRDLVIPTFFSLTQPLAQTLQQLADAGVQLVELHGDAPGSHCDLTDDQAVRSLARLLRTLPLKVHAVHGAFSQPSEEFWDISQPDDAKRTAALHRRMKVVSAAAYLKAHHLVIHPGTRPSSQEKLRHCRESLDQLADVASAAGVKLAVENLPPDHVAGSLNEMEYLLAGSNPAVVGFCLDTGHALLGPDAPEQYIRALGDRLIGIHWHNNDGTEDSHIFPTASDPIWEGFFRALDEVGYNLPITIEALPVDPSSLWEALHAMRITLQAKYALF